MMKRFLALIVVIMVVPWGAFAQEVVNVFNWEDYIDEEVLEMFEEETGIHVNYMRFTTNEDMMVQVEANPGAFDVVFPSEYCVERMIKADLLQPINYDLVPNFKFIRENLKNPEYDPQNTYSVPYMTGTLGILYNPDIVDEEDVKSWDVLWNGKYAGQVLMMDSIRDAMGIALKYLGYSMNSTDFTELRQAADILIGQKASGMVKAYGLDEFKDKMVAEEAALAVVYSGDAQYAIDLNDKLRYSLPLEGSNIWGDSMVVPKAAKNTDNAMKFIDFLCRPDIAVINTREIWYISPNEGAIELMGDEYTSKYVLNPSDEEISRLEYFRDLDATWLTVYNTLWQEIKNTK